MEWIVSNWPLKWQKVVAFKSFMAHAHSVTPGEIICVLVCFRTTINPIRNDSIFHVYQITLINKPIRKPETTVMWYSYQELFHLHWYIYYFNRTSTVHRAGFCDFPRLICLKLHGVYSVYFKPSQDLQKVISCITMFTLSSWAFDGYSSNCNGMGHKSLTIWPDDQKGDKLQHLSLH